MAATVTVDLGFGDQGKGSIVDYLARAGGVSAVVRYSGGPQAGHRVVEEGREHVFSQFGAGTFVPGVRTHLSRHMLVNPLNLAVENEHLRQVGVLDALDRLTVDEGCLLVTPFHVAANRLRELTREERHGSCGMGVGEARGDALRGGLALRARDVLHPGLREKLEAIQEAKRAEMAELPGVAGPRGTWRLSEMGVLLDPAWLGRVVAGFEALRRHVVGSDQIRELLARGDVVFEGAQGVLLDERHGLEPYRTWTDTTSAKALELLAEAGETDVRVLGITRAYATRHGPGPFPTFDAELTTRLPDAENVADPWQGDFRVGWPDMPLLRYAIDATGGVDELVVTCLDRVKAPWRVATRAESGESLWHAERWYEIAPRDLVTLVEEEAGVPVTLESRGPTAADKTVRGSERRDAYPDGAIAWPGSY